MIRLTDPLVMLWQANTLITIPLTLMQLRRLRDGDPELMCRGCRVRRGHFLRQTKTWAGEGPTPGWFMILWAILQSETAPALRLVRWGLGVQSPPACVGQTCPAHLRYRSGGRVPGGTDEVPP